MKRIAILCTLLLTAAISLFAAVGCGGTGFTLSKTLLELNYGESEVIQVLGEGEFTWSSSNDDIVTVTDGGVVTAVGGGAATITATAKTGAKATCVVTVIDFIDLTLVKDNYSLCRGYKVQIEANKLINDKIVTGGEITYLSSNQAVATVDQNGLVSAIKNGTANITVTWLYEGKIYTKTFAVIVENKVVITFPKNDEVVRVYGQEERTTQLQPTLTVNHQEIVNPQFTWTSENDEIATVSQTGLVTGVGLGKVKITASYEFEGQTYSNSYEIETSRTAVTTDKTYKFGYKNQNLIMNTADFIGEVQDIVINAQSVEFDVDVDTGKITVPKNNFDKVGSLVAKIYTSKTQTEVNLDIITAIIFTKDDLDKMDEWGRPSSFNEAELGTTGVLYTYSGVFALGADIDYEGESYSSECYIGSNGYVSGSGAYWAGLTFDGQGYSIKNIHFAKTLSSLFGMWLTDSTVKNLALTGVVFDGGNSGTPNVSMSSICQVLKGTSVIENVFVQADTIKNTNSLSDISFLAANKEENATIKNVVVDFNNTASIDKVCGVVNVGGNDAAKMVNLENCYTIGSLKNIVYTVANGTVIDGKTYTWGTWYQVTGSNGGYLNAQTFLADKDNITLSSAFTYGKDAGQNTVLKFFDKVVKTFADGPISYTFAYKQQDLVLPAEDFVGAVTSIKLGGTKQIEFTVDGDGDYVIAKENFVESGVVGFEITTESASVYKNVKVITAVISTKEDLDKMDEWGRPSHFDEAKLGTAGVLYAYSGEFVLGADIDYKGESYSSECYIGANGYVSGSGAYWKNLTFDGQGYSIKNIHFANGLTSIFGMWLVDSTVKNLALTGVVIEGGKSGAANTNVSTICQILKGTSVIENVFVQGDTIRNANSLSDISFLAISKEDAAIIKNVVVDFNDTAAIDKICGVVNVGGNDAAKLVNLENCYTIGSLKNIVYTVANNTVIDGITYRWGTWYQVTGSTGGYANENDFIADKNNVTLSNAFAFAKDGAGNTILKFFGKVVKTFADGDVNYKFGYKNQDLILPAEDFDGAVTSVKVNGADLAFTTNTDGDYVIARSNFTATGVVSLEIKTANSIAYKNVEIVTAVITSVDDFKKIASEWGSTGTYVLAADLDFKGETYSNSTTNISAFNFDGQGYSISNVVTASLFGRTFKSGTIKNLSILNLSILAANYSSGLVQSLSGGNIENVYVSGGFNGAIAHGGIIAREYLAGSTSKLNNIVVDVLPTNVAGSSVAVIARINGATVDSAIPEKITNVYSMGWTAKHITFPDKIQPQGWDTDTLITAAKGGYADAAAFLSAYDSDSTMLDSKVFQVIVADNGDNVLQLYNSVIGEFRTVKVLKAATNN